MKASGTDRGSEYQSWVQNDKTVKIPEDPKNGGEKDNQSDDLLDYDKYLKGRKGELYNPGGSEKQPEDLMSFDEFLVKHGKKVKGTNPENKIELFSVEKEKDGKKS